MHVFWHNIVRVSHVLTLFSAHLSSRSVTRWPYKSDAPDCRRDSNLSNVHRLNVCVAGRFIHSLQWLETLFRASRRYGNSKRVLKQLEA